MTQMPHSIDGATRTRDQETHRTQRPVLGQLYTSRPLTGLWEEHTEGRFASKISQSRRSRLDTIWPLQEIRDLLNPAQYWWRRIWSKPWTTYRRGLSRPLCPRSRRIWIGGGGARNQSEDISEISAGSATTDNALTKQHSFLVFALLCICDVILYFVSWQEPILVSRPYFT